MKDTKVILISGSARHGKDTIAGMMKEEFEKRGKSVMIYHFADVLKMICENCYGWTRGDKGPIGRTILQNVGSNYRSNYKDCWVDITKSIVKACDKEIVIIPDCRYQNEAKGFGEDAFVIRVERPNFDNGLTEEQKKHISENDMNKFAFNAIVYNDGTIEQLKHAADKVVDFYEEKKY